MSNWEGNTFLGGVPCGLPFTARWAYDIPEENVLVPDFEWSIWKGGTRVWAGKMDKMSGKSKLFMWCSFVWGVFRNHLGCILHTSCVVLGLYLVRFRLFSSGPVRSLPGVPITARWVCE